MLCHEFQSTAARRNWRASEIMVNFSYTIAYTACRAPHYEFGTTVGAKSISTPGGYQEGFLCRLGRSDGSFEQFCCCGVIGGGDSSAASAEELKDDLHA